MYKLPFGWIGPLDRGLVKGESNKRFTYTGVRVVGFEDWFRKEEKREKNGKEDGFLEYVIDHTAVVGPSLTISNYMGEGGRGVAGWDRWITMEWNAARPPSEP